MSAAGPSLERTSLPRHTRLNDNALNGLYTILYLIEHTCRISLSLLRVLHSYSRGSPACFDTCDPVVAKFRAFHWIDTGSISLATHAVVQDGPRNISKEERLGYKLDYLEMGND